MQASYAIERTTASAAGGGRAQWNPQAQQQLGRNPHPRPCRPPDDGDDRDFYDELEMFSTVSRIVAWGFARTAEGRLPSHSPSVAVYMC